MNKPVVKSGERGITIALTRELKLIGAEYKSEVDVKVNGNTITIERIRKE